MLEKIKAAVRKVIGNKNVQSVARHAVIAGGAVLVSAVAVGGVHAVTVSVAVAAAAAALRVVWLAVQAKLPKKDVPMADALEAKAAAAVSAEVKA